MKSPIRAPLACFSAALRDFSLSFPRVSLALTRLIPRRRYSVNLCSGLLRIRFHRESLLHFASLHKTLRLCELLSFSAKAAPLNDDSRTRLVRPRPCLRVSSVSVPKIRCLCHAFTLETFINTLRTAHFFSSPSSFSACLVFSSGPPPELSAARLELYHHSNSTGLQN